MPVQGGPDNRLYLILKYPAGVIPAKAGIHLSACAKDGFTALAPSMDPAFAGMTEEERNSKLRHYLTLQHIYKITLSV